MSVTGNRPPPYLREGTAQCLANIRRDLEKLQVILSENRGQLRQREALHVLWIIEEYVGEVEDSMDSSTGKATPPATA